MTKGKARLVIYAIAYGVLVVAFYGYVVAGLWLTITFLGLVWVLPALIGLGAGPLALCCLCARFRFPPDKAPGDSLLSCAAGFE